MITTGNIPTTVMVPSEYTLEVKAFVAVTSSTNLGQGAKEGSPEGSFTFTDASQPVSRQPAFESKENSFNVRASGGVKIITGYSASNRELGVVLEGKSSAWSILSDENSKIKVSTANDLETLEAMCRIPISTWRYQGQHVTHMGPMAQDMYAAFGVGEAPDRISTSDADGAILSALRGLSQLKDGLEEKVDLLRADLVSNDAVLRDHTERIAAKDQHLASLLQRLETLERLAYTLPRS